MNPELRELILPGVDLDELGHQQILHREGWFYLGSGLILFAGFCDLIGEWPYDIVQRVMLASMIAIGFSLMLVQGVSAFNRWTRLLRAFTELEQAYDRLQEWSVTHCKPDQEDGNPPGWNN